MEEKGE